MSEKVSLPVISEKPTVDIKPPKPEPKKAHVNNLALKPLDFCCGAVELGNFNYVDAKPFDKEHYHKVSNFWKSSPNQKDDPTTKEDIQKALQYDHAAVVMCTTGAGQEYIEPILTELGFKRVDSFINPDHANTEVKLWTKAKKPVSP